MSELPINDDQIRPLSVVFAGDTIEIDFFDPRRTKNGVTEFTKVSFPRMKFEDQVEQLEILLADLVDDALSLRKD